MSHTYAQNVIHVVFSAMDLLQVSPRFYLVIPLPDEGRKRGLFFRRRRTCLCSAWAVDVPCTLPDNDHRIGCGKVFAVEMLHTSQM